MMNLRKLTAPLVPFFQGGLFPIIDCNGPCDLADAEQLLVRGLKLLWAFGGTLAVLIVFWGAFQFITASGDTAKAEAARKTLWSGLIGLIIVAVGYAFTLVFANIIAGGRIDIPSNLNPFQ